MKLTFELDGIEYKIPPSINLESYVKLHKIKGLFDDEYFAIKLINILTGAPIDKLMEADRDKINYIFTNIYGTLPNSKPAFLDRFVLDGIEYGFIPSWKKMSFGEFADLDTLMTKKQNEMLDYIHIITAILYRPIIKQHKNKKYEIEKYNQITLEDRAELFKKKLDVEIYLGAQFFFIKFVTNYSNYTPTSLKHWMKMSWIELKTIWKMRKWIWRNVILRKDLDGSSFLTEFHKTILQNINKSLISQ